MQSAAATSPAWYRETPASTARAAAIALLGALLIGGLTSLGQKYLPPSVNSLSNSAGGWTAFTFLLVWLSRARPLLAGILGIVAFEAMTEAYGLVTTWRGYGATPPFGSIWSVVGLLAGPVIGVAASFARYASPLWRALGVAVLSAVLVGEGLYGLVSLLGSTSPVYWWIEVIAGVGFLVAALIATRLRPGRAVLAVAIAAVGTGLFYLVCTFVL
jgi:hypothetical protein